MRLHVFLARAGVASRRAAERLVAQGRVSVNGSPVRVQGFQIDPSADRVSVDGKPIAPVAQRLRYFIFHKPRGVVTTLRDPHADKTVADFFRDVSEKLFPAGRLDKDSTGLVLMTSDGELVHRLTHPRFGVEKRYRVGVRGNLSRDAVAALEKGILLGDKETAPCQIHVLGRRKDSADLRIVLREGRKREIREMMKRVGCRVDTLHRESYGPLRLGKLRAGQRRELTEAEAAELQKYPF